METIKKYWWAIAGVLVLWFMSKKGKTTRRRVRKTYRRGRMAVRRYRMRRRR